MYCDKSGTVSQDAGPPDTGWRGPVSGSRRVAMLARWNWGTWHFGKSRLVHQRDSQADSCPVSIQQLAGFAVNLAIAADGLTA